MLVNLVIKKGKTMPNKKKSSIKNKKNLSKIRGGAPSGGSTGVLSLPIWHMLGQ